MSAEEAECSEKEAAEGSPQKAAKVEVLMCSVGDAPIMKSRRWAVDGGRTVADVVKTARKYLRVDDDRQLFVYVAQCFAPPLDCTVRTLADCYGGSDGKLTLHYCLTHAWG